MDKGNIQDWLEEWFELSQMNSSIELGTNNEAGPAEVTGFSRKADKIPKRKKHRPKVVKEKKITKIQKSTTGKPAKEKETRSTGKRKYVRKKGLSATTNQPPSEDSDMQNKAGKIKARRSLNFNEDDRQKNADQASQAQVTEASFNPEDPRSSIYAVERTHAQVACHWGGTSSSISDSFNLMQANSVSNGLTFDLNYSINQIPNKCGNLMDGCGQLSESAPRETMQINQLQDFYARMPDKSGFHLNQMQNSSVNSGQYVHSSTENTSRSDQMIHGYMMPKYPAAHTQHTERVSIRQNANPKACTREAVTINQMLQDHRLPESPITPSIHSERDAMRSSLNEFSVQGDCLSFATNRNNHNEASFGLPNSYDFPQILTPVGNQREHGPMVSLDTSFQHSNSSRPIHNDPHSSSSRGSYLTETCRKVRSESQKNLLIGAMGKFSSSSAYLPSKWNTNEVSATNSGVCTLADVQRSMALNKSRCHQRMISSGVSELSRVGRPNRVQQHNQSTLCNTSDIVFDAESTINSLGGNNVPNNIQRMGSHQLQSLEVGPTLHYSIDKDCIALPDKQPRYSTAEHMQLPSGTENPFIESYFPSDGIHQPQYLEKRMVKGPELVPETHHASAYDDTVNNYCIAIHEEQITGTGVEAVGQPISKSTRTDLRLLDASGENKEANPTKKPRGRPKKQQNNGKPKGRGTRKETVSRAKHLSSKGKCTDNEPILCGSEPSAGTNTKATTSESKRSAERTPSILEISDLDNYRSIGSKHIDGAITEVIALSADPLDAVIEKFNLLYISKSDEVIAAACNKGISDALVPLQGNANKKRSRPRVDIDPVTSLMWNLLMAPNMSDDAGGMDKDTEKLLDEERRVFRGRIDAFIARMHLVQGDRRFSPWKGSVVDSVVGVFLTQNVSDHLSSSAFMAVAAKFPVKPEGPEESTAEMSHTPPGQKDSCSGLFGDSIKLKGKFSVEEIHNTEFHEGSNSNKLIGSFSRDGFNFAAGKCSVPYRESLTDLHENRQSKFVVPESGIASVVEDEVPMEDASSSQNSAVSSQHSPDYPFHRTDPVGFSLLPYFPEKDHMMINLSNRMTSSTGHAEHPTMQDFQNKHNDMVGSSEYGVNLLPVSGVNKDVLLDLNRTYQAINTYVSYLQNGHVDSTGVPFVSHLDNSFCTGLDSMFHPNVAQPEASFYQLPSASTMSNRNKTKEADCSRNVLYCMDESLVQQKSHFPTEPSQNENFSPIMKQNFQPLISSVDASLSKEQLFCEYKFSSKDTEVPFAQQHECSNSQEVYRTRTKQMGGQSGCSQPQLQNIIRLQAETCENYCVSNLCENQNAHSQVSQGVADPIRKPEVTRKGSLEVPTDELKGKKVHRPKKKTCDWERIRKNLFDNDGDKPRSQNAKDSVDWEAVRQADVEGISETIRERGLNNMLAGRIKEFLNRLVRDHGSIDLEWLRDLEPEKAKEYLLSIRGLGLKSTECVRLLTLRHVAFPVDTNVARICVRLGWVPLQPLPESVQLHLLELYPVLDHIQKYLWPRLCKLDQLTLYELHYQMITFGKVFCSKRKPNCNACPMRAECKHFASAFASARLFLTGPEEKSSGASENLKVAGIGHQTYIDPRPVDHFEWNVNHHNHVVSGNHKPIVEEPSSPDPEPEIAAEASVEDLFTDDPDEIPTINLNMEEFTQNLRSYMLANNIDTEDTDMSKALVAITPEASSIPTPKLKNVSRLRTVHKVYELPDEHPILEGFDPREPDDPCPYHLSIWTPGETAQSADAPKIFCNFDETGKLCGSSTCFSCNSAREMQAQKVRATILIPCRTAMRGSFPLNGTYFQVNELFADHHSSINPIDVPREWIWNLPRRTVYFGTSTPTIFRGLTTEQIQLCFWTGFVCVRGFDRIQRALRPLNAGLHLPATKVTRDKRRAAAKEDE